MSENVFDEDDGYVVKSHRQVRQDLLIKLLADDKIADNPEKIRLVNDLMKANEAVIVAKARIKATDRAAAAVGNSQDFLLKLVRGEIKFSEEPLPADVVAGTLPAIELVQGQTQMGRQPLGMDDLQEG